MTEHCTQCLQIVPETAGYSAPGGELLCGPCYFALWGPHAVTHARGSERRRPRSRRDRGRPVWTPGPTRETDASEPVRGAWWRRRAHS